MTGTTPTPSVPPDKPAGSSAGFILAPDTFSMQWLKGYAARAEAMCWSPMASKGGELPQMVQLLVTLATSGSLETVDIPKVPPEATALEPKEWSELRTCVASVARTMRFPTGQRAEQVLVQADCPSSKR